METTASPPWIPSLNCPKSIAKAFEDRDAKLLARELAENPLLLEGAWFMCLAGQVRFPDPSRSELFVPGSLARVAISIQWWEGLDVIKSSGYRLFEDEGVEPGLALALQCGDVETIARAIKDMEQQAREFPSLPLIALAGKTRDESRSSAALDLIRAFRESLDPWAPVPCRKMPAGIPGTAVSKVEAVESRRVSAVLEADPDLFSSQVSLMHTLLSENLPDSVAALAPGTKPPAGLDHELVHVHWFSGSTRHADANARASAQALFALVSTGISAPSFKWLIDRSRSLEVVGTEKFDDLMSELVEPMAKNYWRMGYSLLDQVDADTITRYPAWLGRMRAMASAETLRQQTMDANAYERSISRL